jgi:hypothetical protein
MSVRYICGAVTAVVLTCAPPTVARAQAQGAEILPPDQSGMVTVAGCLQVRDADHKNQYILANPVPGPVDSVPDGRCSATIDEQAFDLDKTHRSGMNESLVGHFIEISGRLEKETHVRLDNLRELSALSFRLVPVVPPRVEASAAPIAPAPAPKAETPPAPAPVATTGTPPEPLPKTASPLPAIGLLGLFTLAGGFALRVSRRLQRG